VSTSFAQRNWSDFERLAFELTKDCFDITPTKVLQTQESKDGGFDAVFIQELGKLGKEVISYETLMEAKLRSSSDALGLRAFAATMVIAFNGHTQCLVVVTNREFSPQALEAARDFQWKARLQLILVSRKSLSAWIRPRLAKLKKRYSAELLKDLILPNPEDEKYEEIEISGGPSTGDEPPATIAFGLSSNGKLAGGKIVFPEISIRTGENETVIGKVRQKVAKDLSAALDGKVGCAVMIGGTGTGKSHIIRAALAEMSPDRRCLGLVDLAQVATSRQLFLAILAGLLGLEMTDVARQFTSSNARQIFSMACGTQLPEETCNAVLSTLISSSTVGDVDQLQLTNYLSFMADRAGARLLVFHNLDKATTEVLEFLRATVPVLTVKNVSILLELTVGDGAQFVGTTQWKAYIELFERAATLGRFIVPAFELKDGIDLLLEKLPGLGRERARFICERVGNKPLFLQHAALWLKQRHVVAERAHDVHLVEQPEIFFEGLRPEASLSVLDRHIDIWRREIDLPYADAITAAALLNGHLPAAAMQLLKPREITIERLLDGLVETGLFIPESRLKGVKVSHSLLLERMIAIENGEVPGYGLRRFDRERVASKLFDNIETYTEPGSIRDFYSSSLLFACERWEEAWKYAQSAGRALAGEYQLALASEAFSRGVKAAENLTGEGEAHGELRRTYSLVNLLQTEDGRYRLGRENNLLLLEDLATSLRTVKFPAKSPVGIKGPKGEEIKLRSQYLLWRVAFTREKFDEALPLAHKLFDEACDSGEINQRVVGKAIAALGITLKALEQVEESKRVFERGVSRFPDSVSCLTQQWSNLAAFELRDNPAQALQYYLQIREKSGADAPLLSRVHLEVDIAMALFLMGSLKEAAAQAVQIIQVADANGLPAQAARGRNILGCAGWREERTDDALELFDRAVLDAERSYMERFLWRFRVNLASTACELRQFDIALANSRWAEERILKARTSHLEQQGKTATYLSSRWYVALLALGLVYHRCEAAEDLDRLTKELMVLPDFRKHLKELLSGSFPAEVFDKTTHRQGDKIMITG
jgi:tetratricopeptide (TPR) repeat protein